MLFRSFTSAPAAAGLIRRATETGQWPQVHEALRGPVRTVCVGPVTAAPLLDQGLSTSWPERFRIGALVRRLAEDLPAAAPSYPVAGRTMELRGHAVILDGALHPVPPAPMTVLRALCARPGRVVTRADLLARLPGGSADEHAVEATVGRLRSALGDARLVQTVVKRGYRLALEPQGAG